ncbi:uncharacterized protein C8Q71DRAFT_749172, partial [Rhodofomes roseus]
TEMSVEDHCIVSFAAFSAFNVIYCNELGAGDLETESRLGRLNPNITKNLFQCAQVYQNSEPDFLNHPACPKARQTKKVEAEIRGVAQLGNTFKYKTPAMRRPRSCIVILVAAGLESTHYTIKHLTAKDPDGVRAQPVTLSEEDFRKIWDARVRD